MKKIIKSFLIIIFMSNSLLVAMERETSLEADSADLVRVLQELLDNLPTQPQPQPSPAQSTASQEQTKEELKRMFPDFEKPLIDMGANIIESQGGSEKDKKTIISNLRQVIEEFNIGLKTSENKTTLLEAAVYNISKNLEEILPQTSPQLRYTIIQQVTKSTAPLYNQEVTNILNQQAQATPSTTPIPTIIPTPTTIPTPAETSSGTPPAAQKLPAWATIQVPERQPEKIKGFANIRFEIDTIERMRTTNPQEKADQKEAARAVLLGIDQLAKTLTLTPEQKKELLTQVERILTVDPLLMPIAIAMLRKIGLNDQDLYSLITKKYSALIDFIEKEFNQLKANKKLSAGVSFDIYEALTYPITLSSETQEAQIFHNLNCNNADPAVAAKAVKADKFTKDMNDLHQRLLNLIGNKKDQFSTIGIDLSEYEKMLQGNILRSYCRVREASTYVPVVDDIVTITNDIATYTSNKNLYSRLQRESMLRSILNRINALVKHFTHQAFCSACLAVDLKNNWRKQFNDETPIAVNTKLTIIKDFLNSLPNASADPTLLNLKTGLDALSNKIAQVQQSFVY